MSPRPTPRPKLCHFAAVVSTLAAGGIALAFWQARAPQIGTGSPLGDLVRCGNYSGLPQGWGQNPRAGMVYIPGGTFEQGSARGYPEERPQRAQKVAGFWIDRTEVTNAQFAAFVNATGYVTTAERQRISASFQMPESDAPIAEGSWWQLNPDAHWQQPEGQGSDLKGRENQPVVLVSFEDAQAYARWLGRALPTEAQWEYAAKAGRSNEAADAALRDADGKLQANFWQGLFPYHNEGKDGFTGRAPVGCYPPNPWGLHDMVGNVWEWTTDLFSTSPATSTAPSHVIKGGSYLCASNYCSRARTSSRQGEEADLPSVHLGFRTVRAE
ncbi:formylglycine-generating enzyme family protein [Sinimarinibacterium sp. NLF-5-8]|uniref:formylglycine-generating enzyme family protein n=1 Tax=Sinimarinibacterium sp. NLF-5-8 TaxID=2698684 RepID=UPI00137B9BD2|nr:formylglycine-generating enzyme family protein [Sinimarinibacterium sp. NLF-5-8]QHS11273.1 formylglycine-generating enzyme family protein [Sinimarinibacterium sp. NLF-5-8]